MSKSCNASSMFSSLAMPQLVLSQTSTCLGFASLLACEKPLHDRAAKATSITNLLFWREILPLLLKQFYLPTSNTSIKQPDNANPPRSDWELLAILEKPQDRIELCLESRRAKLATMVRDWQGGPGALGPSRIGYPTTQSYAVEHFTVS